MTIMDINELRAQAIAEHEEEVNGWVEQKKGAIKTSLIDRLAANQREHDEITGLLQSFEPVAEVAPEDSEVTEPQG